MFTATMATAVTARITASPRWVRHSGTNCLTGSRARVDQDAGQYRDGNDPEDSGQQRGEQQQPHARVGETATER
jgi:uncharacterized protein (DUF433 family)